MEPEQRFRCPRPLGVSQPRLTAVGFYPGLGLGQGSHQLATEPLLAHQLQAEPQRRIPPTLRTRTPPSGGRSIRLSRSGPQFLLRSQWSHIGPRVPLLCHANTLQAQRNQHPDQCGGRPPLQRAPRILCLPLFAVHRLSTTGSPHSLHDQWQHPNPDQWADLHAAHPHQCQSGPSSRRIRLQPTAVPGSNSFLPVQSSRLSTVAAGPVTGHCDQQPLRTHGDYGILAAQHVESWAGLGTSGVRGVDSPRRQRWVSGRRRNPRRRR